MLKRVPSVLLVTGPVGVGKSAVLREAEVLLAVAEVPHATVVMEEIARSGPAPPDDPYNRRLMYRNLAALWSSYADGGRINRLLVEMVVEDRAHLEPLREAIPHARLTIVRLRAPLGVIEDRLRMREPDPEGELSAARWWVPRMDRWAIEDFVVENGLRPIDEVAADVLTAAGWLSRTQIG